MSWDVLILSSSDDDSMEPLGDAKTVRSQISKHLKGVDWTDPSYGIFEGDGFSIEFNLGEDDPIESIMLNVRGQGNAIAAIVQFAKPIGWAALDCSTSEFLDLDNPSQEGWEGFQDFRDRALGQLGDGAADEDDES